MGSTELDNSTEATQGATEGATAAKGEAPPAPEGGYLPFVFSQAQPSEAQARLSNIFAQGILPPPLAYSIVKHWMEISSWLESHDRQLMSGMVG